MFTCVSRTSVSLGFFFSLSLSLFGKTGYYYSALQGNLQTYIVLFKQLTGIGSPGLYPRCSSRLPSGSWPLNAVASELKKDKSATAGSQGLVCSLDGIVMCVCVCVELRLIYEVGKTKQKKKEASGSERGAGYSEYIALHARAAMRSMVSRCAVSTWGTWLG